MSGPFDARLRLPIGLLATALLAVLPKVAGAQQPAAEAEATPGQFFTIAEPITYDVIERVRTATRHLVNRSTGSEKGSRPILVFAFLPGTTAPGKSEFGACWDLATLISQDLAGAKLTVAHVPQPLHGYAVLPAMACTEIVMGSKASLGPITPEGKVFDAALRQPIRILAARKTRDPNLLEGMFDRDADLRLVRTADKTLHYVMAQSLAEFQKTHQVIEEQSAWEGGQRGVLSAARAREEGFCKLTADTPAELASIYQLSGQSAQDDPLLGQVPKPVVIKLDGPLDPVMISSVARSVEQARQEKLNLIFFHVNSPGGVEKVADDLADLISSIKDLKTVAYIDDRALGVAALVPLACRDIIFRKSAHMGDVRQTMDSRNGQLHDLDDSHIASLAGKVALLARQNGHPEAVAVAMVDPGAEVVEAKDNQTGASRLLLRSEVEKDRVRYQALTVRKERGTVLTVTAEEAAEESGSFGLGRVVSDFEDVKGLYGLRGQSIRIDGPGWVDSLVTILTDPYVSWLLLFIGGFMLVVELKLPGIGLPAITSALAFLLFFWSHYLSGTADQLEIILFLVGLVCLALELFVFPGFGVFGMSGIMLMLCSIVMASHTFIWPTHDYEYREMGYTLLQLTGMMAAIGAGAAVLGKYFPSLPLFNRLVLKPEPWIAGEPEDSLSRPGAEGYEALTFLIGESGRTTSPLRPTGKARFGNVLVDVTAVGAFVEPDSLVEVVDVQGPRVIVKKMGT
jgi:membrane-bound serine protease (ClpP class)